MPKHFSTKTRVPFPPPGFVSRPRLLAILQAAITRRLTIVRAPAGFGKSTLLAELARDLGPDAAWLTLDPSDYDLAVFAGYLADAIAQIWPGFGAETLAWLAETPTPATQVTDLAAILLGELEGAGRTRLVLILDDFHEVADSTNITNFLDLFVRYLPAHVHLVLSSRTPSAVMTSRVIVQQQVTGVGADELRFRPDEVGRWLAARDAAADAAAVDRLVAITEGWVAGMVLQSAAEDVTPQPGIPAAELYDYLSSEVLDRQPPDVRDFLLQVAVLPELSVSLAQNVLGLENAAALLDTVQRQQLFLQPVGGRDEPVYRLHQLFRDFLASRLAATDPARFVDLHSRAAGYYTAQGDFPAAMEHHFQIADWHAAATLAADVGPAEIEAGRVERVERWIARFPAGEHHRWPGLLLLEARLLAVQAELVSASDMLTWGERLLLEAGDRRGYADALVLRAGLAAGQGNGTQMVEYAQQALAISEAAPATRARAQHMAAIGYTFAGDSARSEAAYTAAQVAYAALGDRQATAVLTSDWGFSLVMRQDVQRAALQLERALDYARQANNRRLQARVLSNLAEVYQTRGELDEARDRYAAAAEIARSLRWHRVEAEALQGLADIALVEQGPRAAEQLYEQSAERARTGSPATLVTALAGIACCRRRQGRYEGAARAAQRGLELAVGGQMSAPAALCRLELGAAQVVHGPASAIALLQEAEAELHALDRRPLAARCAAALATALAAAYDYVGAAEALARAYAVADPRGVALQLAPELATATGLALIRHADGGSGRYAGLLQEVVHYLETELRAEGDAEDEPLQIVRSWPRVLEVYSFGRAAVFRDGVALAGSDWQTATAKELFFYLVDCPEGRRKEIILADLWPDQDPQRASENFHTSLRRLRRALGSDAVRVEDTVYRLNAALGLWHDGAEVLALIHRARQATAPAAARGYWTTAASFMRGPFAEEFYGEWAAERRTAWEARAREVLGWLAEDALRRADYVSAGTWAQELCALDPVDEHVYALLMQIAAGRGDIGQVHQQFATLRRVLWDALGTAPSGPAVALYRRLVAAAEPPA